MYLISLHSKRLGRWVKVSIDIKNLLRNLLEKMIQMEKSAGVRSKNDLADTLLKKKYLREKKFTAPRRFVWAT